MWIKNEAVIWAKNCSEILRALQLLNSLSTFPNYNCRFDYKIKHNNCLSWGLSLFLLFLYFYFFTNLFPNLRSCLFKGIFHYFSKSYFLFFAYYNLLLIYHVASPSTLLSSFLYVSLLHCFTLLSYWPLYFFFNCHISLSYFIF